MKIILSDAIRDAIRKTLDDVEKNSLILDVYRAAQEIQKSCPEDNIALEDIMTVMMTGRGSIRAIEFDPRSMVLEVVYPVGPDDADEDQPLAAAG